MRVNFFYGFLFFGGGFLEMHCVRNPFAFDESSFKKVMAYATLHEDNTHMKICLDDDENIYIEHEKTKALQLE